MRSVFLSDDYWLHVYSLIAKMSSKLKSMIISAYSGFSCSVNASLKRVHLFAMAITAFFISTTYLEVTIILYVKLVSSIQAFLAIDYLICVIIFFFFIDQIFMGCVDSINHKWRVVLPSTSNCCCLKWRAKNPWHDF